MRDWIYKMRLLSLANAIERRLILRGNLSEQQWPEYYAELTDELAALDFKRSALIKKRTR